MKRFALISINLLVYFSTYAQINDLEIVNNLIGKDKDSIETILDRTNNDYTITQTTYESNKGNTYTIFIEGKFGGVKQWTVIAGKNTKFINPITKNRYYTRVVNYIRINYIHNSSGHLKDFKAYNKPKDSDNVKYIKSMGVNQSHFEATLY